MTELIDIFREEVDTNLKEATRLVLELEQADTQEPERALTEALMRVFHTLKGAARAVGFEQEKQIAHRSKTSITICSTARPTIAASCRTSVSTPSTCFTIPSMRD